MREKNQETVEGSGNNNDLGRAYGRSLTNFEPLTLAEEDLRAHARQGCNWNPSRETVDGLRESKGNVAAIVRPAFLRFLVLGGDARAPVHDRGIEIEAAYIGDVTRPLDQQDLDFRGCSDMRILRLKNCYLQGKLNLDFASAKSIYLDGCSVEMIKGIRAQIDGSLYLRFGFEARDGLDLSGSYVTGSISCRGGRFRLRATPPKSERETGSKDELHAFRLDDAHIQGTLILGPRHKGDTSDPEKDNNTELHGPVSLNGASCAALFDRRETYQGVEPGTLGIHGFRYGRIAGPGATDLDFRVWWLDKQMAGRVPFNEFRKRPVTPPATKSSAGTGPTARETAPTTSSFEKWLLWRRTRGKGIETFSAQPYEYLAGMLSEMGHERTARRILLKRSILQHEADQYRRTGSRSAVSRVVACIANVVLRYGVGYGYRPRRAIYCSLVPIIGGALIFANAYRDGLMIPNNASADQMRAWMACARLESAEMCPNTDRKECQSRALPTYPSFNPVWYSLDTFVPIVSLRQKDYWIPGPRCRLARHYLSLHIILGWLMVTLGLSGVLGFVQRRGAPSGK